MVQPMELVEAVEGGGLFFSLLAWPTFASCNTSMVNRSFVPIDLIQVKARFHIVWAVNLNVAKAVY